MRKMNFVVTLAVLAVVLAGSAMACSNKKSSNSSDTPTGAAATPGETPQASTTPPASGTPAASAATINLVEWQVIPQPASVAAGAITFNVKNIGSEKHSFVLIKSDQDPAGLLTLADGSADESQLTVIDQIPELAAGTEGTVTADLAAGNYVLICNIVDTAKSHVHYKEGMHTKFTVTG